ncbi:MAG: hypothetical protein GY722_20215 [bacterium]|nr:hypothetical protein [bacterium]
MSEGGREQPYPMIVKCHRNRRAAMSIQEFHSKMRSGAESDSLFEALRVLQTVEDLTVLTGEDGESLFGPWNTWPEPI